jgi:N-acetyl-gamma-glutamyl-phosphate reductase
MQKKKIVIIGASGYTGVELIRILLNHLKVEIISLVAMNNAGEEIDKLYSHLYNFGLPILQRVEEVDFSKVDIVFGCLPHTTSQQIFQKILADEKNSHLRIIDLSADFRLEDAQEYKKWYGYEHLAQDLQKKAVYGLPEFYRIKIKNSQIIACPGCYPTSVLLPLLPLIKNQLINPNSIIIDSKSGNSGAGRTLKTGNLFCEVNESVKAYNIGKHRHISEIEQELSKALKSTIEIDFTPHLLPINRGIISTIYVEIAKEFQLSDLENCLSVKYEDEFFVDLVDFEPSISDVSGSNRCLIVVKPSRKIGRAVIVSVIDNLCKGASGQAVQNMNIICGFDEDEGLRLIPTFF